MNINAGTILISTPSLDDSDFEKVVILITEYNEKGTMGFVINKLFPRTLNQLVEFQHIKPFPLCDGGPVERESLFFIHQQPNLIQDGEHIIDTIYLGGNFKQAINNIHNTTLSENNIKLFIGYCGWDFNQLEEEIKEGSWLIINASMEIIFNPPSETLWTEMYQLTIR